jgi:hypothetical protein
LSEAEQAFARLAEEVAAEAGSAAPAAAGAAASEQAVGAAAAALPVSVAHIDAVMGRFCPGFFPFC